MATKLNEKDFEILKQAHCKVHDRRNKVLISQRGNRWLNTPAGRVIAQPRPKGVAAESHGKRSYVGVGRSIIGIMITDANGEIKFEAGRSVKK